MARLLLPMLAVISCSNGGGAPGASAGGAGATPGSTAWSSSPAAKELPTGIAVDATSVYWANRDAGTIVKVPAHGLW